MKELSSLRADLKAKDASLEAFELSKTQSLAEISIQAEKIKSLEQEVKDLQKSMGKFVQGEESLKSMMKQARGPHDKGGIGAASTSTSSMKYEGKNGIPYNYAMPWMTCHKCGKKGHLASNCSMKKSQSASWKGKSAHRQYKQAKDSSETVC